MLMNSNPETKPAATKNAGCFILGLQAISLIPVAIFLSTWFASFSWLLDLLCNFQVIIFWALAFCVLPFLLLRRWRWVLMLSGFTVVSAWCVFSIYLPITRDGNPQTKLRMLSCNIYHENENHDEFISLVREVDPDIFVVIEFTPQWQVALEKLGESYPYQILEPRLLGAGVGVYSRVKLNDTRIFQLTQKTVHDCPVIRARLTIADRSVSMFTVHALSPRFPDFQEIRDEEIRELADLVNDYQGEKFVVGDFNATTWLPIMREFMRTTGLNDSRQGFGIQPTWPQSVLLARIPIDHVFVSNGIAVHSREVKSSIGSDHFPIVVELSLAD